MRVEKGSTENNPKASLIAMANIITRCAGFKFIISLHEYIKKKYYQKMYIQTFLCSKHFCIKLKYAGLVVAAAAVVLSLVRLSLAGQ